MPPVSPSKYLVQASWDDVPHLDAKTKAELIASMLPHQRDARMKGIPALGAGAIYPVPESEIICHPFQIPAHWPRAFGMDVGWNKTAVVWGAMDRTVDCLYVFSEYYKGQAEPTIHTAAIKARGDWVPGVIDPAANGRGQKDGEQLIELYRALGLNLENANNSVEAGLYAVWERLSTGRMKIFSTCQNILAEYRIYRRDEKGAIVKKFDHAMDALRYLTFSGIGRACVQPVKKQWEAAIGSAGGGDRTVAY